MIRTWQDRCMEHPDHKSGMVSHAMIQARMQEEIDELRAAVFDPDWDRVKERKPLTEVEIYKLFGWYAMPFVRAVEKAHGIGVEE